MKPQVPIDITREMSAYFGLVEIGRELAIQGLMLDGHPRDSAEREWTRLQREQFLRKDLPAFSSRFPGVGLWE